MFAVAVKTPCPEAHQFPVQPGHPHDGGYQPDHQPAQQHADATVSPGQQGLGVRGPKASPTGPNTSTIVIFVPELHWTKK